MAPSTARRTVIRQWMSLAPEKRRTEDQALAFARKALPDLKLPRSRRDPLGVVLGWLLPRTGRS